MPARSPIPELDVVMTVRNPQRPGMIGRFLTVVGERGALVGDIETVFVGRDHFLRDVGLTVFDEEHLEELLSAIHAETDTEVVEVRDVVFERHLGGKVRMTRTTPVEGLDDLRTLYTPGVARVCRAIEADPALSRRYTAVGQTVGVFTNGTRVLGLGDIGPLAALPVMEGKAVLYDRFVGLSAIPMLVDTTDPEEFVDTVCRVAPTFGGIHLEDIRTPDCFWIEDELVRRLDKPVMHDDQHGTATVLLAAVLSALRLTGQPARRDLVCVQVGLGAAGLAIAKLLLHAGFPVIGVDPSDEARDRLERGGRDRSRESAAARGAPPFRGRYQAGCDGPADRLDLDQRAPLRLSLRRPERRGHGRHAGDLAARSGGARARGGRFTSSRVLLLTDSESVVPVRRAKDDVVAFAEGRADGSLRLRLINLGVNPIKVGDVFVTSGSGGLYPARRGGGRGDADHR